jgi:hypothetical protein
MLAVSHRRSFLNPNRLLTAVALFLAAAGIAHASRNPTPPTSGIVVHLFGPNSIMSNITPDLPGETAKPAAPRQTASSTTNSAGSASSMETSDEPSWHDVLHQMFVVGDPEHPNKPAGGRPAERENVQ